MFFPDDAFRVAALSKIQCVETLILRQAAQ